MSRASIVSRQAFWLVVLPFLSSFVHAQVPEEWQARETVALENGRWFDGRSFRRREVVHIADGRIKAPVRRADRRVDLDNAFVVTPFGDVHTHMFNGPYGAAEHRRQFLRAGVFYVMTMTAAASSSARIRHQFHGATNVDVLTALGGITGPESHPAEIYEAIALSYLTFAQQLAHRDEIRASRRTVGNAYHPVSNIAELDAAWALLLSQQPDFVKVYLRHSELYAEGYGKWGPGGGLDPTLLPAIADRARKANLRLAVSASSVADFRAAVAADAAILTHLPCYQDTDSDKTENPYYHEPSDMACKLTAADVRRARRAQMASTLVASEWVKERPQKYEAWEAYNVHALLRAGARLVIGSNSFGSTLVPGLIEEGRRGLFTRAHLLRIVSIDTPRTVHPDRNIGCLQEGCEASFLVLNADPLRDLAAIQSIRFRVKDGVLLTEADIDAAPPL